MGGGPRGELSCKKEERKGERESLKKGHLKLGKQ